MRINALVAKAQKKPEDGWVMQDGTPWPGNNTRDHPGMIQVSMKCILSSLIKMYTIISIYIRFFYLLTGLSGKRRCSRCRR